MNIANITNFACMWNHDFVDFQIACPRKWCCQFWSNSTKLNLLQCTADWWGFSFCIHSCTTLHDLWTWWKITLKTHILHHGRSTLSDVSSSTTTFLCENSWKIFIHYMWREEKSWVSFGVLLGNTLRKTKHYFLRNYGTIFCKISRCLKKNIKFFWSKIMLKHSKCP